MASHDSYALPDVVISGALALDLVEVLEYARLRTAPAETEARDELDKLATVLEYDMTEAAHKAFPQRWIVGIPPEDVPEGVTVLDEVPRPLLSVPPHPWAKAPADRDLINAIARDVMARRKNHGGR